MRTRMSQQNRFLHLKSEIRNYKLDSTTFTRLGKVQFVISDFGFEMQESSNLKFSILLRLVILFFFSFFASCSKPPASSRTFTLGITSGAQEFVDFVMEGH